MDAVQFHTLFYSRQVWKLERDMIMPVHTFECGRGAVLSLVTRGDAIYAGCQDGYVTVRHSYSVPTFLLSDGAALRFGTLRQRLWLGI